jgi:MFS family permease
VTLLLVSASVWACYVAFALLGLANTGAILSDLTMTMEFGPDNERPVYYSLARTLTAPALLAAPLLGGWIVRAWGYQAMFGTALALAALGLALLIFIVREPRQTVLPAAK